MNTPFYPHLVLAAVLLSFAAPYGRCADVAPAQPVIPDRTFKLTDYGAKGNGYTMNTDAIRSAIAAVNNAGGGTLVIPSGTYLTGALDLCSSLNLHLETNATILFSPDPDEYLDGQRYRALLRTSNCHDVMISGNGTINGSGEAWWPAARIFKAQTTDQHVSSNTLPRPTMVAFNNSRRICVQGILLTKAPVFNLVFYNCDDATADHIRIVNPSDTPNTDGIDALVSHRVLVTHCFIDTGDDGVAMSSSSARGIQDILITDCTFGHGHGVAFGSETNGGCHNVIIRNCSFENSTVGMVMKANRTRGGPVDNIVFENLTMKNVGQAIIFTSYYPLREIPAIGAHIDPMPVGDLTPQWSNITIRNIVATGCTKNAGVIIGLPEAPATNITLSNVTIEAPTGLRLGYAKDITLDNVTIKPDTGAPLIVEDTVEGMKQKP